MNRTIIALAAASSVLCGCTATGDSEPDVANTRSAGNVPQPGEAWVLYQGEGQAGAQVRLIRPDGTGDHPVLTDVTGTHQTNPDWSPAGDRFVFALTDGRTEDLWVADVDGSDAHVLVDCERPCNYLDDPAWSPDGREIAVARTSLGGRRNTLEIVDVATGSTRIALGPRERIFFAGVRWSPDGFRLAFESVRKTDVGFDADITGVTLSTLGLSSGRVRHLTDPTIFAVTADWSPDGSMIAFSALPPGAEAPDLWTVRPNGSGQTRVTTLSEAGGYAAEPTFTPTGRTLVFSGQQGADAPAEQLLQVSVEGGRVSPLVDRDGRHPRWRPGTDSAG